MTRNWRRSIALSAALALASVAGIVNADETVKASNKWRIEVSGNAESAGTIGLKVTPHEGTPVNVSVSVADRRGENDIAKDVRDALGAQLPAGRYRVEVDDGEDVLIKKAEGQPDFTVELASSSPKGVRLHVERE